MTTATNIAAGMAALIIAGVLGGGGVALLMSGPVGWLIGLVVGVAAGKVGKDKAEAMVRQVEIPVMIRRRLIMTDAQVAKQCEQMRGMLQQEVRGRLDKMEQVLVDLVGQLNLQLAKLLDAKVDEARLLIK